MNVFFDLDGTLLDSRQRLFMLFTELTSQKSLNFEQYWKLKRSMHSHKQILCEQFDYSEEQYAVFEKSWMGLIEDETYLAYDKPFPFTKKILDAFNQLDYNLYVVTSRQDKLKCIAQLKNLEIYSFFKEILVTENKCSKAELLKGISINQNDIFVGDTGVDVNTAKELGIISVAVLSGFRDKNSLEKYKPNFIENNIENLLKYV